MSEQLTPGDYPNIRRGRKEVLPWGLWFNGHPHRLKLDEDMSAMSVQHMVMTIRKTGYKKGFKLKVLVENDTSVIVQKIGTYQKSPRKKEKNTKNSHRQ